MRIGAWPVGMRPKSWGMDICVFSSFPFERIGLVCFELLCLGVGIVRERGEVNINKVIH